MLDDREPSSRLARERYTHALAASAAEGFDADGARAVLVEHPDLQPGHDTALGDALSALRIAGYLHPLTATVALTGWGETADSVRFRLGAAAALLGAADEAIDQSALRLSTSDDAPVNEVEFGAIGWMIADRDLISHGLQSSQALALDADEGTADATLATLIAAGELATRAAALCLQHHHEAAPSRLDAERRMIEVERLGRLVGTKAALVDELAVALLA